MKIVEFTQLWEKERKRQTFLETSEADWERNRAELKENYKIGWWLLDITWSLVCVQTCGK